MQVSCHSLKKTWLTALLSSLLPLYHGPLVKIRIKPGEHEYTVSKDLLCRKSSYFSAMLNDGFKEGKQQSAVLEVVEGVVTVRSFEALVQWIYFGSFKFAVPDPVDHLSAIIEFARLADMCNMTGMRTQLAKGMKEIILASPKPAPGESYVDVNTQHLTTQHSCSVATLPTKHPVRRMVAAASVEGYLRNEKYKFADEIQKYPTFAADLLEITRMVLKKLRTEQNGHVVDDPLSGRKVSINHNFGPWQ